MKVSVPVAVAVPAGGVIFAESIHTADFRMAERTDRFHKIVYVLRGAVTQLTRSSREQVRSTAGQAGSVFVVPAGMAHRFVDQAAATLMLLCLDPRFVAERPDLAQVWATLAPQAGQRLPLDRVAAQRLEALWRRALLEQSHPRLGSETVVRALATQSVVQLARLPARPASEETAPRLLAVLREVEETFFEAWTLDRAALRAGMSRRRCSELVRQQTGQSFGEYVLDLRLRHAAKLLRSGEYSVLGVMFTCGFNDASTFYRVFKRRYRLAPKAWQQEHAT